MKVPRSFEPIDDYYRIKVISPYESQVELDHMNTFKIKSMCVFCGSADGLAEKYLQGAYVLGKAVAEQGMTLIYGGGRTGLMGALAEGALQAEGKVVGIIPENLNKPPLVHDHLTRLEVVQNIHQRKARMNSLADAFIALPGGYGTLDELFETLTWAQIGLHTKPVGLLNINGYFGPLLEMIKKANDEGFIYDIHRALFVCSVDPYELLKKMHCFHHPDGLDRWVNR